MYVGVIRGDMPGPIFIADVEPLSQTNFPTEPFGQSVYVARPSVVALTDYLGGLDPNYSNAPFQGSGGVPAGIEGTLAPTFPVVISGANNTLQFRNLAAAAYTTVTVASGSYATMANLLVALNAAIVPTGLGLATTDFATGTLVVIQSSVPGVGSYIDIGAAGTINATLHLPTATFTMPTAAAIIAALNPVGGPVNVSPANVLATLGASPAAQGVVGIIAPHFTETLPAIQSFQVGVMSKFLEATYTPNPTLLPPLALGPAIQVVQDDGVTPFVAGLPIITGAVHNVPNPGDITITGVDLGNVEHFTGTEVRITGVPGLGTQAPVIRLNQHVIVSTFTGGTQGVVTATSIVIPASLLSYSPGGSPFPPVAAPAPVPLGVAGSTVEVQFSSLANSNYGTGGTVGTPTAAGVVTLTTLARMQPNMVGNNIVLSGAAHAGSNGTFVITSYISATSVTITNINAFGGDTVNWSVPAPVQFIVT